MSWQRPHIGSRVTREGQARFWERPGGEVPRATRQNLPIQRGAVHVCNPPKITADAAATADLSASEVTAATVQSAATSSGERAVPP